jgi:hypothetical protein
MSSMSYSTSTPNRTALANLTGNLDAIVKQARVIAGAVGEIGASLGGAKPLSARQMLDSIGLKDVPLPSLAKARSCGVPACHCPSPDLGEVCKVLERAERTEFAVRVRNTTSNQRSFQLSAGKLQAENGQGEGVMSLSDSEIALEPGQFEVVRITVDASKFPTGIAYIGAIQITAKDCETMYLGIVVRVQPQTEVIPVIDLHCCCHPKARPLRWYHHYYCDPAPEGRDNPNG